MTRIVLSFVVLLVLTAGVAKSDGAPEKARPAEQHLDGMSIVGNDESPKSLAIVPWKDSKLGDTLDALRALDGDRQPVDKEVFLRELDYYAIRVGAARAAVSAKR